MVHERVQPGRYEGGARKCYRFEETFLEGEELVSHMMALSDFKASQPLALVGPGWAFYEARSGAVRFSSDERKDLSSL